MLVITNKLHSELCLLVIGRETRLVKTFGEVTPKLVTCDIVQMCLLEMVLQFIFLAIQYQRFVAQ